MYALRESHRKIPIRCGYSLLETVVVISLLGVVMSVLVGVLSFGINTEQIFSAQARKMQTIHSLASHLRHDIHRHNGKQISIDNESKTLHLDNNISYRWENHRIWREVKGEKKELESYWFPKNSLASWSKDGTSKMITLQIEIPPQIATNFKDARKTFRKLIIKAEAGRFVDTGKGGSR